MFYMLESIQKAHQCMFLSTEIWSKNEEKDRKDKLGLFALTVLILTIKAMITSIVMFIICSDIGKSIVGMLCYAVSIIDFIVMLALI